jgi:hypothetical protein
MVALRDYFEEWLLFEGATDPWAFRCTICCALVVDRELHLEWHQRLGDMPKTGDRE